MSEKRLRGLARIVRMKVRKERSFVVSWKDLDPSDVRSIAEKAGCDWLVNYDTGEIRFFEGN